MVLYVLALILALGIPFLLYCLWNFSRELRPHGVRLASEPGHWYGAKRHMTLGTGRQDCGGCALKLSPLVGKRGSVVAEDIRRESLFFLRIRAFLRGEHNVNTIRGETDDPRLLVGSVDAILIANTYHELKEPKPILRHLADSLKPGGSLVIVDRGPRSGSVESREKQEEHHELRPDGVETEVRNADFEIVSRQDQFIDRPGDAQIWWLLVARKR